MSATPDVRLQANFKLPNGDLINVYGKDAFDFKANLEALIDTSQLVLDTGNLLRGVQVVVDAGLTGQPAVQQQPQVVHQYRQAAPVQPPAPAPLQLVPDGPPGPVCKHGPMEARSGSKNNRAWSAHFCPAPKGTPDQCDPVWG